MLIPVNVTPYDEWNVHQSQINLFALAVSPTFKTSVVRRVVYDVSVIHSVFS